MATREPILCMALTVAGCAAPQAKAPPPPAAHASPYPVAPRGDVAEDHFGVRVADPYRGLEAMDSEPTRTWVLAENRLTDDFFAKTAGRDALRTRLGQLFRHERFGLPVEAGGRAFWRTGDGQRDQDVIVTAAGIDGEPAIVVDPNLVAAGGVQTLTSYAVAATGKRLAYGLAVGGGDWETWHVRDVGPKGAKADLADTLTGIKYYAPVFTHDGAGIYYSRFPSPKAGDELTETDHGCRVYFHRIGVPVDKDVVVYERPESPTWQFQPWMSADGRFLVIEIGDGQVGDRLQEQIVALDLSRPGARPAVLVDRYEAEFVPVGSVGSTLLFITDLDAPTKRIIAIDSRAPDRAHWREVVPAGADAIADVALVGSELLVTTLHDVHAQMTDHHLDARLQARKVREVPLPGLGTAFVASGRRDDREAFFLYTSFTAPAGVYRYDLASGATRLWKAPTIPFEPATMETRQIFFAAKDGTRVPMFVTMKKGLALDGSHPTVLTGYGGFGLSFLPEFADSWIAWIEHGGVYVVANIRGGGDYGEAWHRAAIRTHRQVAYDDFIGAAEALIAEKITSTPHLGIIGTSGGGQLVGAVLVQRPELFGAAVPIAGVLDMMRFQLFGQGAGWEGDLGSPDDPDEMRALLAYSPLHNVRAGTRFPPTLIITSDHDVRVPPLHSYKMAATMQAAQAGDAPVLLRIDSDSGHGGGDLLSQKIDQNAEILMFLARELGLPLT